MSAFELVQRLTDAPDGKPRNLFGELTSLKVSKILLAAGALVDLDYMGSAEYSNPKILINSANRIADSAQRLKVITRLQVVPHYREYVSFVCTDEQEETLLPAWDEWSKKPFTKEPTGYLGDTENMFVDTVGWWALGEDLIWSRKEQVAENIRSAFVAIHEASKP